MPLLSFLQSPHSPPQPLTAPPTPGPQGRARGCRQVSELLKGTAPCHCHLEVVLQDPRGVPLLPHPRGTWVPRAPTGGCWLQVHPPQPSPLEKHLLPPPLTSLGDLGPVPKLSKTQFPLPSMGITTLQLTLEPHGGLGVLTPHTVENLHLI